MHFHQSKSSFGTTLHFRVLLFNSKFKVTVFKNLLFKPQITEYIKNAFLFNKICFKNC